MGDITKVQVGPCTVTFNGIDIGHTLGGVEVTYEPQYMDVMVDKYGQTVVEKFLTGEKLTAKVPMSEYTIANLRNAMPQGTFAGAANTRVLLGRSAGAKALALAAQLVLHPINLGTRASDIVLHKAYASSPITLAHKIDEQKVIEVEFEALLDESKADGNYLGLIGDSTT